MPASPKPNGCRLTGFVRSSRDPSFSKRPGYHIESVQRTVQLVAVSGRLRREIKKVWGAFGQVQKFVDCLCQALICWTKGCQAVYRLSGAKAIAECKEKANKDRCDKPAPKRSSRF
jgi:hypothetical protein